MKPRAHTDRNRCTRSRYGLAILDMEMTLLVANCGSWKIIEGTDGDFALVLLKKDTLLQVNLPILPNPLMDLLLLPFRLLHSHQWMTGIKYFPQCRCRYGFHRSQTLGIKQLQDLALRIPISI